MSLADGPPPPSSGALLGIARLFAPRWIEVRGCIVRSEAYDPGTFEALWRESGGDRRAVELAFNTVRLAQEVNDPDEELLHEAGRVLAQAWRATLRAAFPGCALEVQLTSSEVTAGSRIGHPEQAHKVLALTGPSGRTLEISQLAGEGQFVLDDPATGERLGDLNGDLMPFVLTIDDERRIIFAGVAPRPGTDRVEVTAAGRDGIHQMTVIKNGVWMTFPEPYTEGMVVTATWYEGEQVSFQSETGPLNADRLQPVFGPDWTSYAPLS